MMHSYHPRSAKVLAFIALLLLLAGVIVLFQIGNGVFTPKQEPAVTTEETPVPSNVNAVVPTQREISGTVTCLPHKNMNGPQTLECAIGVQTAEGTYYALDTQNLPPVDAGSLFETGSGVRLRGMMTPIEMLSSNQWQKYNVEGILTVEAILQ